MDDAADDVDDDDAAGGPNGSSCRTLLQLLLQTYDAYTCGAINVSGMSKLVQFTLPKMADVRRIVHFTTLALACWRW
jgi:hypothetical protein